MFISSSWFTFFTFFLVAQVLLILIIFIYFYLFGSKEILWKFIYLILGSCTLFFLLFNHAVAIYFFLSRNLEENLILTDPQNLIEIYIQLSLGLTIVLSLPIALFYFYSYFSSSWNWVEQQIWLLFLSLFIYNLILVFLIVDQDLFLANYEVFSSVSEDNILFEFQPEMESFFLAYWGEYYDLFFIFLLFYFFVFLSLNYWNIFKYCWYGKFKLLILVIFLFVLFYFFGGETLFSDIICILTSFILFEILNISLFFFVHLSRLKI